MKEPGQSMAVADAEAAGLRPALRFLTCGSVDDGKSTLMGRLLYEQNLVCDDQLVALERDSRQHGHGGEGLNFASLLDGLEAEREQGVTIDVAYRYFTSEHRAFVVADAPGHAQYTRNMATAASNCALIVLLVDASKGLLAQTRRHAVIARMFGIRHVVLAVNKVDLVDHSQKMFDSIARQFSEFAGPLDFSDVTAIPISARDGDNVTARSARTPWYSGPTLIGHLETVDVENEAAGGAFRLPVQSVNRPGSGLRGFAGTIAGGGLSVGDEVVVLPSGKMSRVTSILGPGGPVAIASGGYAVTVTLADEIDIARGDMLAAPQAPPFVADQFAAHVIWMADEPLLPGRSYLMKINHTTISASVTGIRHRIDTENLGKLAAATLALNEIGVCNVSAARPVVFDAYADNRTTGAFILIDRISNATVAAGMIDFPLRRAGNVRRQPTTVTKAERSRLKHHQPAVLWFTGLSGSGKSTIANLVETKLNMRGVHTLLLDGDNVRHGLNRDLGFTEADRVENIRRTGEVAKLMTDAGLLVLCSFISPFRAERDMVREMIGEGEFIEIFVDTPLAQCIARDPKGLYRRAMAGEIMNFTGVDQAYDVPPSPELHLRTEQRDAAELASDVIRDLERRKII